MPTRTCPYCEERSNDGHVCHRCTAETRRNLLRIIDLWPALQEAITRRDNVGGGNGEVHAQTVYAPLPYNPQASAIAERVREKLVSWARVCIEDYGAPCPADTIAAICRTIADHRRDLRRHPDAGGWVWDVAMCVRWITSSIDLTDRRTVAGPCPETTEDGEPCPGIVMAVYPVDDRVSPHLDCSKHSKLPDGAQVCGRSWPASDFRRLGARIAQRQKQIDGQIARAGR